MPRRYLALGLDLHVRYSWNGQLFENVWQYRVTAPVTGAQCAAIANAWITQHKVNFCALFSNDVTMREVYVRSEDAGGVVIDGTQAFPPGTVGTHGGRVDFPNGACSLTLKTNFGGRSNTGKKSIGPLPATSVVSGVVQSEWTNLLNTFATHMLVPLLTNVFLAVGSGRNHTVLDVLIILLKNAFLDSQKTRLIDHGT
jgi:hypothetical protein